MSTSSLFAVHAFVYLAALTQPTELAERARFAERDLDYDRAADLWLEVIGNPETTDALRFEANLSAGAIERIRGNDTEARFHFQYVLRKDPEHRLPDDTPPKVRNFFELVRQEVKAEATRAGAPAAPVPIAAPPPEKAPPPDAVVDTGERPRAVDESALAILPLSLLSMGGAAVFFSVVGVALGGVFGGLAWNQYTAALASDVQVERVSSYEAAQTNALVANLGYGAAALFFLAAVGLASAGGVLWAIE
jgi:hypothetical protein